MEYFFKSNKDQSKLLTALNNNILKHAETMSVQSMPNQNGTNHHIEFSIAIQDKMILVHCHIFVRNNNSFDKIIVIAPNGENEQEWKNDITNIIETAELDSKLKHTVFTCHLFGYIGPILDGKYLFSDFYITPGPLQNNLCGNPDDIEQILCIYLTTTEASYELAQEAARLKSKKLAALLSVFLGVGLYEYDHYDLDNNLQYTKINKQFRWVYNPSNGDCISTQLGYTFSSSTQNITLGGYRSVNRNEVEHLFYNLGEKLKCPEDITKLFDKLNQLATKDNEKFYRAAALMQFAELQRITYPSVTLAYAVAAIDALPYKAKKPLKLSKKITICTRIKKAIKCLMFKESSIKNKIREIITTSYPNIDNDLITTLYKSNRCAHFHEGHFYAGEFKLRPTNPFAAIDNSNEARAILAGYDILKSSLIKWLLIAN
jgi:hypothetical protein